MHIFWQANFIASIKKGPRTFDVQMWTYFTEKACYININGPMGKYNIVYIFKDFLPAFILTFFKREPNLLASCIKKSSND